MYKNTWWYRLLQVLFVAGFLASAIASVVVVYNKYHPRKAPLSYNEFVYLTENNLPIMESNRVIGSWTEVVAYSLGFILIIAAIFFTLRKLFFYIYKGKSKKSEKDDLMENIFRGFMDGKYTKIHNPAGLSGIEQSPKKYSVGEEINDEKLFQAIKLLPKGNYDSQEKIGDAIVFFNNVDVRPKPKDYAEGVQDIFGLLEVLEAGRMALCDKVSGKFYTEIKKGVYRDNSQERYQYFFPDGRCFFDIKTASIDSFPTTV